MAQEHHAISFPGNDTAIHDALGLPKQPPKAPTPQKSPPDAQRAIHEKDMPWWQPIDAQTNQHSTDGQLPASVSPAHVLHTVNPWTCDFPTPAQTQPPYSGPYVEPVLTENYAAEVLRHHDPMHQPTTDVEGVVHGIQATLTDILIKIGHLQSQYHKIQQTLSHLSLSAHYSYWGWPSEMVQQSQQLAQNQYSSFGSDKQYSYHGLWPLNDDPMASAGAPASD